MGCISATSKRNKTAPTNAYLTLEEVRPGRNLRVLYIKPTTKLVDDQLENNKKQNNATEETLSPELTTSLEQQTVLKKSDCELIKINNELTLFFFHGVGGSCETWQNQFDHFIDYKIVAVDFIGHGHSSISNKKEDYAFNEILDDLLVVFDKYASNKNILIGHSYGSCFAAAIAKSRTRNVTKLILISGGAPLPLAPQPGFLNSLPLCCLCGCERYIINSFERNAFSKKSDSNSLLKVSFNVPVMVLKYTMDTQVWLEGNEEFFHWILKPTLLIHGEDDLLVSIPEVELMHNTIANSRLEIIPDAGHMVMLEKPDKINQLLREFITST